MSSSLEQYSKARKYIWESMLDSDMNLRYWKYLTRRYSNYDKYSKIFLAVMTSGTVASWGFWNDFPLSWKVLSACSALIAIALPILNFQKSIETMSDLNGMWTEIKSEYEYVWSTMSMASTIDEIFQQHGKIFKKEMLSAKKEAKLPHDSKLLLRCHKEVAKACGG